jgi:hypothetical protein
LDATAANKRSAATAPKKHAFSVFDRLVFVGLCRLFPKVCDALAIVKPETIVRWHRAGFRSYRRWKSRPRGGRPTVPLEIRPLIREMSWPGSPVRAYFGATNMHRTNALDCFACVMGEMYLVTDVDGVLLRPGDTVIIRGTNHVWIAPTSFV